MRAELTSLLLATLLGLVACGDEGELSCPAGEWRVQVTKTKAPCFLEPELVQDTCVVIEDPVAAVDSLFTLAVFPDECAPVLQEGILELDCFVSGDLDSLLRSLNIAGLDSLLGDVDLHGCEGELRIQGGGSLTESAFDYAVETSFRCLPGCGLEALPLCLGAQAPLGPPGCPVEWAVRGRLQ